MRRLARHIALLRSAISRTFALALALGLLLGGTTLVPMGASALDDPALATRVERLDNGLVVLLLEDRTTPVVSFQVWVRAGSRDELRYTGIAHLFEHMMFKGSKNVEPEKHAQYVEQRGGRINAFTSRDVTVYFEDVPPEALPLVIELEAERFRHLEVSAETLASEREVVLEERRLRTEDRPDGRAFEALFALTFTAHPYRWPVIGWRSDVEEVTLEACREFFDTYYAPNNLVVSVSGNFDSDEALALVRRTFGPMEPAARIPRNVTREPEQDGERRQVVHFEVNAPILAAAWHAPPSGHADSEALDVLSVILSSGRSSRLYRRLVYDEQKALAAQGAYYELADAGVFYAFSTARPGVPIAEVEQLFLEEIERLRDEPVSEAELEKARRSLEVSLVGGLGTAHALGSRIGRDWVTFGRIRPIEERLEAIRRVTAADVQRVARTYLRPAKRSVVHVVSPPAETSATTDSANAAVAR